MDRVSVPDLHATLLHQLGLDHDRLTYPHHGRDETPDRRPRDAGPGGDWADRAERCLQYQPDA